MSIDVREGDDLKVAGKDYPIRSCGEFAQFASTPSFRRLANIDASTKRQPAAVGLVKTAAVEHLTGLKCTPLDPVDQEIRATIGIGAAHEVLQTFLADSDGYVHLIIEDIKPNA